MLRCEQEKYLSELSSQLNSAINNIAAFFCHNHSRQCLALASRIARYLKNKKIPQGLLNYGKYLNGLDDSHKKEECLIREAERLLGKQARQLVCAADGLGSRIKIVHSHRDGGMTTDKEYHPAL